MTITISENQFISGTWTPSFYGYDGHGNVRFLTNSAGAITDSYDFDAFGMPIKTSGTTPNQFLYSSERYDSSVGLYDLRARYLNQATGRFWARDPMEHNCCGQSWDQNTVWNRDTARDPDVVRLWVKGQQMRGTRCCGSCSPLQFNPYIYADDDPVDRIDPMGREALMEYLANLWERLKIWVVVLRMGNQPVCAMMYADDMAYCSTLPTGIAERCALFATTRYVACLESGP